MDHPRDAPRAGAARAVADRLSVRPARVRRGGGVIHVEFRLGAAAPAMESAAPAAQEFTFPSTARPGWSLRVRWLDDRFGVLRRWAAGWLYVAVPAGLESIPELAPLLDGAPGRELEATLGALERLRPLAFVAAATSGDRLHFGRSLDGFASLYFGVAPGKLVVSDRAAAVAASLDRHELDPADAARWIATCAVHPESSFLTGVSRCFAGVRYRFDGAGEALGRRLMAPEADLLRPAETLPFLRAELRRVLGTWAGRRLALRLSGGVDSRLLLVGLVDAVAAGILHRDQILLTSVLFPGFACDESDQARELAHLTGFEWVGIEATRERALAAQNECMAGSSPPFPTAFMGQLCLAEARRRGAEVILTGHGGDEIFGFDQVDVLGRPFVERLRRYPLLRTLRAVAGPLGVGMALAIACAGRRGMRRLQRDLRRDGFASSAIGTHRLGRRMAVAPGCGYEASAVAARKQGVVVDAPLFRAGLFARLDPARGGAPGGSQTKAIARACIDQLAPRVGTVPYSKVMFDAAVVKFLAPAGAPRCPDAQDRDRVDIVAARTYASEHLYRQWSARRQG